MKERDVIIAFVSYLRANGQGNLQVDRWPDQENRVSDDIDAVAGPFAIEHTSVDTVPQQRRDSNWFESVFGGLKNEVAGVPFRLRMTVSYGAVTKGQDWAAIREAVKSWIKNEASQLNDGAYTVDGIPGIPFSLRVRKQSDRPPGVFIGRVEPQDDTLPSRLHDPIDRKAGKLVPYRKAGRTTVLLVESADMVLMNEGKMLNAIREIYPAGLPDAVDQIWYVDTSIPDDPIFINFTP